MNKKDQIRLDQFLNELAALTHKHQFIIGGCGECGSPWVHDVTDGRDALVHLTYAQGRYGPNHMWDLTNNEWRKN